MAAGCRYWEWGLGVGWRCGYAFTMCGRVAGHGLCGYKVLADPLFAHTTFAHIFSVWANSSAAYLTSSLPAAASLLARLPAKCLLRYLPACPPAAAGSGTPRLVLYCCCTAPACNPQGLEHSAYRSMYRTPVRGKARGTFAIAPLEGHSLDTSPETLISCIIKVGWGWGWA